MATTSQPIFRYKSYLTRQKLSDYKPHEIQEFGLEDLQQIDTKFKAFSDNFNKVVEVAEQNQKQSNVVASSNAENKRNSSKQVKQGKDKPNKSASGIQDIGYKHEPWIDNLIDTNFKQMLIKNNSQDNPVVSYFGNSLIATVFQSLIIKVIEQKFKIKIHLESDVKISSAILKMFDLSTVAIKNIRDINGKKEYIYSTMCKKIDQLLHSFDDRVQFRETACAKQEKLEEEEQKKSIQKDQFSWLKLKVSHESLRKKLHQLVVEKLSEYENILIIDETIEKKKELKNEGKQVQANRVSAQIKNVDFTTTKDIFKSMGKYGSHKIKQYLSRLGLATYDSSTDKKEERIDKQFWNENKESEFYQQRQAKKYIYSNEVVSSNWNDVGFLPFVEKYIFEYKKAINRDSLIERYLNGEWLTADELRFIANTSELLNSCVDKDQVQKSVNTIDPDIINNMELGLAEQILRNYEDAKLAIKYGRQEFLKQKQEQQKQWLRKELEKERQEKDKIYSAKFYKRYYRMFSNILSRMEEDDQFVGQLPNNVNGAEFLNAFLLGRIDDKETIQNIARLGRMSEIELKQYEEQKEIKEQEKQEKLKLQQKFTNLSQSVSYTSNSFIKNIKRRKYHPSSKLFIEKKPDKNGSENQDIPIEQQESQQYDTEKKEREKSTEIQKFAIGLKSHYLFKQQPNFAKFYTGGPNKSLMKKSVYERFYETGQNNPTPQEIKSALIIQKQARAYILKKVITQQKRNLRVQRDYKYKNIIEQIQMNPRHIQLEKNETFDPLKPNINEISAHLSYHPGAFYGSIGQIPEDITSRPSSANTKTPQSKLKISCQPKLNKESVEQKIPLKAYEIGTYIPGASILKQLSAEENLHKIVNSIKKEPIHAFSSQHIQNLNKLKEEFANVSQTIIQNKNHKQKQLSPQKNSYHIRTQSALALSNPQALKATHNQVTFANKINRSESYEQGNSLISNSIHNSLNQTLNIDNHSDTKNESKKKTFMHSKSLHSQSKPNLIFRMPSFAVKASKYIDSANISSQFAIKEFFLPKTSKQNKFLSHHSMQENQAHPKQISFSKNGPSTSVSLADKSVLLSSATNLNNNTGIQSNNTSFAPYISVSQFLLATPQNVDTSYLQIKKDKFDMQSSQNNSEQDILTDREKENKLLQQMLALTSNYPDFSKIDAPKIIHKLSIKSNKLIVAAQFADNRSKFANILSSGFIYAEKDLNERDQDGNTSLHIAAKFKNIEVLEWLLSKKANPNFRNREGNTPLHFAFQSNLIENIILLISKGSDLNITNLKGETPIAFGSKKIIDILGLSKGICQISFKEGETAPFYYVMSGDNNECFHKKIKEMEQIGEGIEYQHQLKRINS